MVLTSDKTEPQSAAIPSICGLVKMRTLKEGEHLLDANESEDEYQPLSDDSTPAPAAKLCIRVRDPCCISVAHAHITNMIVEHPQIQQYPCMATRAIYVPINLFIHKVLLVTNTTSHNHLVHIPDHGRSREKLEDLIQISDVQLILTVLFVSYLDPIPFPANWNGELSLQMSTLLGVYLNLVLQINFSFRNWELENVYVLLIVPLPLELPLGRGPESSLIYIREEGYSLIQVLYRN
ncbi:hypothetical protein B0H19DRAFT_1070391 [Mycena capillaripes]|nr:hypothetical protein B0H19DRAFT_1070391 [Mycena capillaripes]